MKIVQICGYYPPHLGGIEHCVKNMTVELVARGHEVTVLTSDIGNPKAGMVEGAHGRLQERYLRAVEFAHTPFIPSLPLALFKIPRDHVQHIHLSHVYSEVCTFFVAKLRRLPYVAHFHMDVDVSGRFGFLFKIYKKTLLGPVIRRASTVIALSDEQRQLVIDRYHAKPEHVVVMPNGVASPFFSGRTRTFSQPIKLLYVGRFALQKNLPRLINAMPLLTVPVELHLVGDGEKRPEVEVLTKDLELKNVTLHGKLGGQELVDAYHSGDVFVIPSDREGMPLALVEASAAGLPIVASDVQGLREFVGANGVLVHNPSPETFAQTLNELLRDPSKLQHMSAASREWAEQYAWSELIKRIETVYKQVGDRR